MTSRTLNTAEMRLVLVKMRVEMRVEINKEEISSSRVEIRLKMTKDDSVPIVEVDA